MFVMNNGHSVHPIKNENILHLLASERSLAYVKRKMILLWRHNKGVAIILITYFISQFIVRLFLIKVFHLFEFRISFSIIPNYSGVTCK